MQFVIGPVFDGGAGRRASRRKRLLAIGRMF